MSMKQLGVHDKDGRLVQPTDYTDGRTKQSYKDETDIQKIMSRAEKAGTISHLQKFEGVYADYSDVDFHELTTTLTKGREIFDELPAEIRQEFGQSPQKFFDYVNDPKNTEDLLQKLPALAAPGRQIQQVVPPSADEQAVITAAEPIPPAEPIPAEPTPAAAAPAA